MALTDEEILHRFGLHPGTSETAPKHERLREGFIAFAKFLRDAVPDGRAKSTAMSRLQEVSMWANFGIAELAPVVEPQQQRITMPARKPVPMPPRKENGQNGSR